jgi:Orange carotenoid protein, N-terminal
MASTDVKNVETVILKYRALDADDKLAVLAQLYGEVAAEVAPTFSQSNVVDEGATNLVKQIQQMSSEQQLDALRGLVAGKQSEGESVLDEHPTKALGELFAGGKDSTSFSTSEYDSLSSDSRLFFWFQLAQNLGKSIVGVPNDYMPNERVSEVLDLVGTPGVEDLVSLLKKAL